MKRILSTIMLFTTAFSQSKLDNLTSSPYKKDGRFIGKVGGLGHDRWMFTYSTAFEFWTLFGEPVFMFHFRWDYAPGQPGALGFRTDRWTFL